MSVTWHGLEPYQRALAGWPVEVANEARPIIKAHAEQAFREIHDGYPVVSGHLRDGLTITDTSTSVMHPSWTLENPVYYAKIFEAGGATTAGPKGPGRVFVPIVIRVRRAMRKQLVPLVLRGPSGG